MSSYLLWRTIYVTLLMVAGAFGLYYWSESRGLSTEAGRTIVVNAIVVMELFYLFSVRNIHHTSLTWRGFLATPAVRLGVAAVIGGQLAFTYLPFMQVAFGTQALGLIESLAVIGTGITLLLLVEVEKQARLRYLGRRRS